MLLTILLVGLYLGYRHKDENIIRGFLIASLAGLIVFIGSWWGTLP